MTETISTTKRGNAFRDEIASLLRVANYENVEIERRFAGKKIDIYGEIRENFVVRRVGIEAKDHKKLSLSEVNAFVNDYSNLLRNKSLDMAILISNTALTTDSIEAIRNAEGNSLIGMTFDEFQRGIFDTEHYLKAIVSEYEQEGLAQYYIPARTADGMLEEKVLRWLSHDTAKPLVVTAGYGKGKTTFATFLAAKLARQSLKDPTSRIPIKVPLGDIVDENSPDGLFGKLFTSKYHVRNYTWQLFRRLNEAGRFLIIFDGFDEMKHGMSRVMFENQFTRLLSLHHPRARILILGRDTVFSSDSEFKSLIEGRNTTQHGSAVRDFNRPECERVNLEEFTLDESKKFIRNYFCYLTEKHGISDNEWIQNRVSTMLSPNFDTLITRGVHAQMLCQLALDRDQDIGTITEFKLYDRFIDLLLRRETQKAGRFPNFDGLMRREVNALLSWWMLLNGGASTTTIDDIPSSVFVDAVKGITNSFDDVGLRRELIQGCFIEKSGTTIYFGHRSIQEFLAAEYLFKCGLQPSSHLSKNVIGRSHFDTVCTGATKEVAEFFREFLRYRPDADMRLDTMLETISAHKDNFCLERARIHIEVIKRIDSPANRKLESPGMYWLVWGAEFLDVVISDDEGLFSHHESYLREGLLCKKHDIVLAATMLLCLLSPKAWKPSKSQVLKALVYLVDWEELSKYLNAGKSLRNAHITSLLAPKTYLLLKALKLKGQGAERAIVVDFEKLYSTAKNLLGYGITLDSADPTSDNSDPNLYSASIQEFMQALQGRYPNDDSIKRLFRSGDFFSISAVEEKHLLSKQPTASQRKR